VSTDSQSTMRPLTMNEAAASLGVSRRWLQGFLPTIECPYLRCGHKKLFDETALHAIREAMRCPTNSSPQRLVVGRTGGSRVLRAGSTMTEALRLATSGKRRGSSSALAPRFETVGVGSPKQVTTGGDAEEGKAKWKKILAPAPSSGIASLRNGLPPFPGSVSAST
jgi:hypothetical protein